MPEEIRNVGASVRARLQNLSRETGQSFELILTRYTLERLLYRLGASVHADRFVLKGAMLLTSWFTDPHRATRDLDLLGFGTPSPDAMIAAFKEILATDVEDGVQFDLDGARPRSRPNCRMPLLQPSPEMSRGNVSGMPSWRT